MKSRYFAIAEHTETLLQKWQLKN